MWREIHINSRKSGMQFQKIRNSALFLDEEERLCLEGE